MVVNMLKAISQMLEIKNGSISMDRVACSKIMLDEIIKGMDVPQTTTSTQTQATFTKDKPQPQAISPLATELEPKEPEYKLEVNTDKTLKLILRDGKPLNPGDMLLIDKAKVAYKDAVGKPFVNLKVVE